MNGINQSGANNKTEADKKTALIRQRFWEGRSSYEDSRPIKR